jgi:MFS family permease
MADMRDGIGPYLAVFLKGAAQWSPAMIGLALAVSNIATALALIPVGLLIDASRRKRQLLAGAGLVVGFGTLLIVLAPRSAVILPVAAILGAAGAFLGPGMVGLSLGLVGPRHLPARISRNEGFNHAGNLCGALTIMVVTHFAGLAWIFYLACVYALASAVVAMLIPGRAIDHAVARGLPEHGAPPLSLRAALRQPGLGVFLLTVMLFHLSNAAMLPLAGQVLAITHPGSDAAAMSACIIVAQAVMVGVAGGVGRASAAGFGRKPIFLVGLAVLPLRGVLFAFVTSPIGIVLVQMLDGIGAGVFGVIAPLIAADLMRGTGRINFSQGMVALTTGLGGAASNLGAGAIVQAFGYHAGFLALSVAALAALGLFSAAMPETRPAPVAGGGKMRRELG